MKLAYVTIFRVTYGLKESQKIYNNARTGTAKKSQHLKVCWTIIVSHISAFVAQLFKDDETEGTFLVNERGTISYCEMLLNI